MPEVSRDSMLADVRRGLAREQMELSPKYFYDRRGSELFEEITRLPEYYLTRAELRILEGEVQEWLGTLGARSLVELGAGSGRKTRTILDGMIRSADPPSGRPPRSRDGGRDGPGAGARVGEGEQRKRPGPGESLVFVPVDVSADYLEAAAGELRAQYDGRIRVHPVVADMSTPDFLVDGGAANGFPGPLPPPSLFALLGSTIGNFRPPEAVRVMGRLAGVMDARDRFLLGVDLRPGPGKSVGRVERAYNDAAGVTARFNRNVLRVLNRELGTEFDPDAFRHRAFYDSVRHRIEMHLEALRDQEVALPDGTAVVIRAGETLRTEVSHKYDRDTVAGLMGEAGLTLERWIPGEQGLYAMAVGRTASGSGR